MAAGRPVDDEDRRLVAELHAEGLPRNEIARRINRSGKTVSNIAKALGLTFERGEQVKAATEARRVDAKARRTALALALLDDAEKMRQQLFAACTVYNFGGKDNTFETAVIQQPSFRDKQAIMSAIGVAVDRSVKLDAYDKIDESLSGIDAWLDAMTGTG